MAPRTINVELTILDRRFTMSCPRDVKQNMLNAAATLEADLETALSGHDASNSAIMENLVALALEYLCRELDNEIVRDQTAFVRRIESATAKLREVVASLPPASSS